MFYIKMLTLQTSKIRNVRYKYSRHLTLTAAV